MSIVELRGEMGSKVRKIKVLVCDRCKHEWTPRKDEIPEICPQCKSRFWNINEIKDDKIKKRLWKNIKKRD